MHAMNFTIHFPTAITITCDGAKDESLNEDKRRPMVEGNNRSRMSQLAKDLVEDANLLQALEQESPASTCKCPSNPQHLRTVPARV